MKINPAFFCILLIFSLSIVHAAQPFISLGQTSISDIPNIAFRLANVNLLVQSNGNLYIDGNITFRQTYWDDVYIPLVSARLVGINDPALVVFSNNSYGYLFENNILSQQDSVFFTFQMPHGYKFNSSFEGHLHTTPNQSTACNATFSLDCMKADISGTWSNVYEVVTIKYSVGDNGKHIYTDVHELEQNKARCSVISCIMQCKLMRESANANDTCTAGIFVHAVDFHVQKDTLGTFTEYQK